MKKYLHSIAALIVLNSGCSKSEFLNEKPQKSLLIPSTLEHFQAILDEDLAMNGALVQGLTPQLGESGSDNFYLLDANFNTNLRPQMQNYYIWNESPYDGINVLDWEYPYRAILFANTALDGIENIERTVHNKAQYDNVKGQALFHRAHMFYQLAQVFAPAYNPDSDNNSLGIILRLESDINESLTRATVQDTYDRIINDLYSSIALLDDTPPSKSRPSRHAVYGMLARTYLSMRNYEMAKVYADSCLAIQHDLYDYNLVNSSATSPFLSSNNTHPINIEVIFYSVMLSAASQNYPTTSNFALVDTTLFSSYDENDLRREIFFLQRPIGHRFKGSYSYRGTAHHFSGLAVDEMLLIRAECNVRLGEVEKALDDLNRLLVKRWRENTYIPYEGLGNEEALSLILDERRKELICRGLRWTDLRRFNQEGHNITLTRNLNGQVYTLPPNDPRWTWPLPPEVINR